MCDFNSVLIKTDVTVVKFVQGMIFAGIGGYLHIYSPNSDGILKKLHIFEGKKIYGIEINENINRLLIYGSNKIKLYIYNPLTVELTEEASATTTDWILHGKWIDSDHVVTISMHNTVILWTICLEIVKKVMCKERCILYSALLVNNNWNKIIAICGTVFSEILIWWPGCFMNLEFCDVPIRLKGHNGVIFSISYNQQAGFICSTSDDRSAILWSVKEKDLTIELKKPTIEIVKAITVNGHTSRIFRCLMTNMYFITAGEDSIINIWNFDGQLVRKIETTTGNIIWALDYDENSNTILIGGSDSGVYTYSAKIQSASIELSLCGNEIPKTLALMKSGNLIVLFESGCLKYFKSTTGAFETVNIHPELQSYSLLEVSPNRKFVILAGFHGHMIIYEEKHNKLIHLLSEQNNNQRIFSVHWLTDRTFLTCISNGELLLWFLFSKLVVIKNYILPPSKERWTTAACLINLQYFVVGDRRGSIYLYKIEGEEKNPIQIIPKAHNYLGITHLSCENEILVSLGRNGIVNTYNFQMNDLKLFKTTSNKLAFTWLASIKHQLLLAFSGDKFIVWDYKSRRTLWEISCGGGHRSWDFTKHHSTYKFVYLKDKTIHEVAFSKKDLFPITIYKNFHVKEVNTLRCLTFMENHQKCLLVSGGEDTNLHLTLVDFKNASYTLSNLYNLKSHLSSIRTITTCRLSGNLKKEHHLVFSAGGRAQIIIWKVTIKQEDNFKVICREEHMYYENIDRSDSEMRIMDLKSLKLNGCIVLFAACSDGNIKVFSIDIANTSKIINLKFVINIFKEQKCLLKIFIMRICEKHVLCTMATNGNIVFWDVSQIIEMLIENNTSVNSRMDIIPFGSIKPHQSGINSCAYKHLSNNKLVLITGGDDNTIVGSLLQFTCDISMDVKFLYRFIDNASHCAQITGIHMTHTYFITTSIDQKVILFSWNIDEDKLCYQKLKLHITDIADVQGIECMETNDSFIVFVYGKGMEMLHLKLVEK